jgi:hypothetical protein
MSLAKNAKGIAKKNNKKITKNNLEFFLKTSFEAQMTNQQKHKVQSSKEKLQHTIVAKLKTKPKVKHMVVTKLKESTKCEE